MDIYFRFTCLAVSCLCHILCSSIFMLFLVLGFLAILASLDVVCTIAKGVLFQHYYEIGKGTVTVGNLPQDNGDM